MTKSKSREKSRGGGVAERWGREVTDPPYIVGALRRATVDRGWTLAELCGEGGLEPGKVRTLLKARTKNHEKYAEWAAAVGLGLGELLDASLELERKFGGYGEERYGFVGAEIQLLLDKRGWNQSDLGDLIMIPGTTVSRMLGGEQSHPVPYVLAFEALGVDPASAFEHIYSPGYVPPDQVISIPRALERALCARSPSAFADAVLEHVRGDRPQGGASAATAALVELDGPQTEPGRVWGMSDASGGVTFDQGVIAAEAGLPVDLIASLARASLDDGSPIVIEDAGSLRFAASLFGSRPDGPPPAGSLWIWALSDAAAVYVRSEGTGSPVSPSRTASLVRLADALASHFALLRGAATDEEALVRHRALARHLDRACTSILDREYAVREVVGLVAEFISEALGDGGAAGEVLERLEQARDDLASLEEDTHLVRTLTHARAALPPRAQGTSRLSRVDPGEILERVRERSEADARAKGVRLEVDSTFTYPVVADAGMVVEVLAELVDNALAHSGAKTVRVSARPAGYGWVAFEVKDDGVGIPERDHARIFEPFSTRGSRGGDRLGVGLVQARMRASAMGGRVSVASSARGEGSSFELSLPATTQREPPSRAPRPLGRG